MFLQRRRRWRPSGGARCLHCWYCTHTNWWSAWYAFITTSNLMFATAICRLSALENMVYFLAKLALLNYTALVYCPSMVAASAVYVARRILHKSPAWTETLKLHTQFTEAQLIDYANLLMTLHSTASESKLQEVFRKYSRLERCAVALIWGVEILPNVDTDLRKIAERVTEKAKEFCISKLITDASVEVWEGDARNVMCEAVEKHHATLLVLGNHGYGAIKRAVLGSVNDYCAHHAHCSVMIVKRPKIKH